MTARRPARSVAFYGYLGSGNIGNDASLETVLAWLREQHPGVTPRCITIAPREIEARYGLVATPLSWAQSRPGGGRTGFTPAKLLGRLVDVPRTLRLAGTADAVIVPGMGVLEESLGVKPWGLPLWLFLVALACRLRNRPFVLLDVGAERAENPVTRRLFVATARLASHVSYRDAWSEESMRRAGARAPDGVVPDLAFAHPSPTACPVEPGLVVVGVMAYYGPDDDPVAGAGVLERYVEEMTRAVTRLVDGGCRVALVGGDVVDLPVARRIEDGVRAARPDLPGDAISVRAVQTFGELSEVMSRAEAVVTSRFHNLIAAVRLGRPVVSVGYAAKCTRLMEDLGLGRYCQDYERLEADRLVSQLDEVRGDSLVRARMKARVEGNAQQVRQLLERLARDTLHLAASGPRATA